MTERALAATVFNTCAGWAGVARTALGLFCSVHSHPTRAEALRSLLAACEQSSGQSPTILEPDLDPLLARAVGLIRAYFAGEPVTFDLPLDLSGLPEFTTRALQVCRGIPWGKTRTYAELAREIGRPKAARAIGQAMRRNPLPLIIPCHRVIGSDGSLVGFAGGWTGLALKARLLELERSTER